MDGAKLPDDFRKFCPIVALLVCINVCMKEREEGGYIVRIATEFSSPKLNFFQDLTSKGIEDESCGMREIRGT